MTDILEELGRQLNCHDVGGLMSLLTDDVRVDLSQLDAVWNGPEEVGAALRALFAAVPDFTWSGSHRYVGASEITEEGVWSGRHVGVLAGHPGKQNILTVRARAVVGQVEGQVSAGRISIDLIGMRLEMGLPVTAVEAASTAASMIQVQASDVPLVSTLSASEGAEPPRARGTGRRTGVLVGTVALIITVVITWGQVGGSSRQRRPSTRPVIPVAQTSPPPTTGPPATAPSTPIAGVTTRGRQLTLSADVLFDVGQSQLTPRAREVITRVAALLAARQPHGAVVVTGYTDNTGSPGSNQRLSLERAQAVVAALQHQAVVSTLIFQAHGLGSSQPVASDATAAGRSLNRRVTIVLPAA
ncbi:MAG: hypothetical protein NVS3B26_07140 [Mycobacteriales bacterium]